MKLKKIISILLLVSMMLLAFSGCGADTEDNLGGDDLSKDKVTEVDKAENDEDNEETDDEMETFRGKIDSVSVSDNLIVALKTDGTVAALGGNTLATSLDVSFWEDIVEVSAGANHILGLRADGTVVTAGYGGQGQRDVMGWNDIVDIHAGLSHSFGLKSDGTVIMTAENGMYATIDGWKDIVSITGTGDYIWGLTAGGDVYVRSKTSPVFSGVKSIHSNAFYALFVMEDGTVVADPFSEDYAHHYTGIESWTDIVDVATLVSNHAIGLRSDGTVVAVGQNKDGRGDVSEWTDIVAIATGSYHTVGLRSDGTVVATGSNGYGQCDVFEWEDIVSVYASDILTVGLKADGTLVAAGVVWNGLDGIEDVSDIATK